MKKLEGTLENLEEGGGADSEGEELVGGLRPGRLLSPRVGGIVMLR